ncbi:hypothetical protein NPIL_677781 [Nephila pilipes]|uniref:CCHC-type domain-containing protein n=1 Tax=Nephila pilipes TaxID=299642 RepID=A0A8X6PK45_NEPPI|nr:hypothetical protein NPIL_677781 [Nephila pilipes]
MLRKCYKCHKPEHFVRDCSSGGDGRGGGYRGDSSFKFHLKFPVTTMAEVATLLENVTSLTRLATLVERLFTLVENTTKVTEE